ncbi:MAG: ABC transporter permease [Nitriliruptoraceae bacterium]
MVKAWALVRVEVTRLLRDRSNLFFVFLFPLLLIVFIGAQFGSDLSTRLGTVADPGDAAAGEVVDALEALEGITVVPYDSEEELSDEVDRGLVAAGVVLPAGYGEALRDVEPIEVVFLGRPDATSASLQALVTAVLAEQAQAGAAAELLVAGRAAVGAEAPALAELREGALTVEEQAAEIEVTATTLGTDELAEEFAGLGQFDIGASSQLFLFTFLTSLAGAGALIQTRQYGVATRMLSTPTSVSTILLGTAGGRLAIALFQAGYIVLVSTLAFGVNWGDPLGATAVIVLFSIVAAATAMVVGSVFSNDSQASGAGVGIGLGAAALGGSMIPIELYPETVARVARITPHAWANEAMAELVRRDGTIVDILPQLGVLAGFAVGLLALGSWTLRRALIR